MLSICTSGGRRSMWFSLRYRECGQPSWLNDFYSGLLRDCKARSLLHSATHRLMHKMDQPLISGMSGDPFPSFKECVIVRPAVALLYA